MKRMSKMFQGSGSGSGGKSSSSSPSNNKGEVFHLAATSDSTGTAATTSHHDNSVPLSRRGSHVVILPSPPQKKKTGLQKVVQTMSLLSPTKLRRRRSTSTGRSPTTTTSSRKQQLSSHAKRRSSLSCDGRDEILLEPSTTMMAPLVTMMAPLPLVESSAVKTPPAVATTTPPQLAPLEPLKYTVGDSAVHMNSSRRRLYGTTPPPLPLTPAANRISPPSSKRDIVYADEGNTSRRLSERLSLSQTPSHPPPSSLSLLEQQVDLFQVAASGQANKDKDETATVTTATKLAPCAKDTSGTKSTSRQKLLLLRQRANTASSEQTTEVLPAADSSVFSADDFVVATKTNSNNSQRQRRLSVACDGRDSYSYGIDDEEEINGETNSIPPLNVHDLLSSPTKLVIHSKSHGRVETKMSKEDLLSPHVTKIVRRLPNGTLFISAKQQPQQPEPVDIRDNNIGDDNNTSFKIKKKKSKRQSQPTALPSAPPLLHDSSTGDHRQAASFTTVLDPSSYSKTTSRKKKASSRRRTSIPDNDYDYEYEHDMEQQQQQQQQDPSNTHYYYMDSSSQNRTPTTRMDSSSRKHNHNHNIATTMDSSSRRMDSSLRKNSMDSASSKNNKKQAQQQQPRRKSASHHNYVASAAATNNLDSSSSSRKNKPSRRKSGGHAFDRSAALEGTTTTTAGTPPRRSPQATTTKRQSGLDTSTNTNTTSSSSSPTPTSQKGGAAAATTIRRKRSKERRASGSHVNTNTDGVVTTKTKATNKVTKKTTSTRRKSKERTRTAESSSEQVVRRTKTTPASSSAAHNNTIQSSSKTQRRLSVACDGTDFNNRTVNLKSEAVFVAPTLLGRPDLTIPTAEAKTIIAIGKQQQQQQQQSAVPLVSKPPPLSSQRPSTKKKEPSTSKPKPTKSTGARNSTAAYTAGMALDHNSSFIMGGSERIGPSTRRAAKSPTRHRDNITNNNNNDRMGGSERIAPTRTSSDLFRQTFVVASSNSNNNNNIQRSSSPLNHNNKRRMRTLSTGIMDGNGRREQDLDNTNSTAKHTNISSSVELLRETPSKAPSNYSASSTPMVPSPWGDSAPKSGQRQRRSQSMSHTAPTLTPIANVAPEPQPSKAKQQQRQRRSQSMDHTVPTLTEASAMAPSSTAKSMPRRAKPRSQSMNHTAQTVATVIKPPAKTSSCELSEATPSSLPDDSNNGDDSQDLDLVKQMHESSPTSVVFGKSTLSSSNSGIEAAFQQELREQNPKITQPQPEFKVKVLTKHQVMSCSSLDRSFDDDAKSKKKNGESFYKSFDSIDWDPIPPKNVGGRRQPRRMTLTCDGTDNLGHNNAVLKSDHVNGNGPSVDKKKRREKTTTGTESVFSHDELPSLAPIDLSSTDETDIPDSADLNEDSDVPTIKNHLFSTRKVASTTSRKALSDACDSVVLSKAHKNQAGAEKKHFAPSRIMRRRSTGGYGYADEKPNETTIDKHLSESKTNNTTKKALADACDSVVLSKALKSHAPNQDINSFSTAKVMRRRSMGDFGAPSHQPAERQEAKVDFSPKKPPRRSYSFESQFSGSICRLKNKFMDACDSVALAHAVKKSHRKDDDEEDELEEDSQLLDSARFMSDADEEEDSLTSSKFLNDACDSVAMAQKMKDRKVHRHDSERPSTTGGKGNALERIQRRSMDFLSSDREQHLGIDKPMHHDVSPKMPVKRSSVASQASSMASKQVFKLPFDSEPNLSNVAYAPKHKAEYSDRAYAESINKYFQRSFVHKSYGDNMNDTVHSSHTETSSAASSIDDATIGTAIVKGKFRRVMSYDSLELVHDRIEQKQQQQLQNSRRWNHKDDSSMDLNHLHQSMPAINAWANRGNDWNNSASSSRDLPQQSGHGSLSSLMKNYNRWSSSY